MLNSACQIFKTIPALILIALLSNCCLLGDLCFAHTDIQPQSKDCCPTEHSKKSSDSHKDTSHNENCKDCGSCFVVLPSKGEPLAINFVYCPLEVMNARITSDSNTHINIFKSIKPTEPPKYNNILTQLSNSLTQTPNSPPLTA